MQTSLQMRAVQIRMLSWRRTTTCHRPPSAQVRIISMTLKRVLSPRSMAKNPRLRPRRSSRPKIPTSSTGMDPMTQSAHSTGRKFTSAFTRLRTEADRDNGRPRKKWGNIAVLSCVTLLTPLASSMFAPGVQRVMEEFHSTSNTTATFVVSVYILGYAVGPLVLAPLSELYGRLVIYNGCNVLYTCFTIGCALATNMQMLIGFRFMAGVFGVAPLTIGGGTIADLMRPEARGGAMAIWAMGPLLGPVIGKGVTLTGTSPQLTYLPNRSDRRRLSGTGRRLEMDLLGPCDCDRCHDHRNFPPHARNLCAHTPRA
jgi:hypothetical protein